MKQIAIYRERRFDGQRTFALYPDHVVVTGKNTLGGEFESHVPLAGMLPSVSRVRIRHSGFLAGIVMVVLAVLLFQGGALSLDTYWGGLGMGLGIGGLGLVAATFRKVEWVHFSSSAGVVVLSLARSGPDVATFERFVELTSQQSLAVSSAISARET